MRPLFVITTSLLDSRKTQNLIRSQLRIISAHRHLHTNHHDSKSTFQKNRQTHFRWSRLVAVVGIGGLLTLTWANRAYVAEAFSSRSDNKKSDTSNKRNEKIFRRHEVSIHNSLDKGVWITFKGNVYDITEFVKHHPGGSHTIMMGAGGDVEPFWQTYTVHHASEVQNLLKQYQIGILDPVEFSHEQEIKTTSNDSADDPYATDPKRSPLLQVLSEKPFNAETPAKLLPPTYLTPTEIFFVRNHLPVPEVTPRSTGYQFVSEQTGDPDKLKVLAELSLDDLKTKFKPILASVEVSVESVQSELGTIVNVDPD